MTDTPRAPGTWINVFSGRQFYPMAPRAEDIDIVDIAHSLSRTCRYTGHSLRHYSVAEHSVRVAEAVKNLGHDDAAQAFACLHDAAEAYLADVASPVRRTPEMAAFNEADTRLQTVINHHYGLRGAQPDIVKHVDRLIITVESERREIVPNKNAEWRSPVLSAAEQRAFDATPWGSWCWPAEVAEIRFLRAFNSLFPQHAHKEDVKRAVSGTTALAAVLSGEFTARRTSWDVTRPSVGSGFRVMLSEVEHEDWTIRGTLS